MSVLVFSLLSLASPEGPALEGGSGFEYRLPKGWTSRIDAGTKSTVLTPPGAGEEAQLAIYPVFQGALGSEEEFHRTMVQLMTDQGQVDGDPVTGKTGRFQWTRVKLTIQGAETRMAMYTAKFGERYGAAAFGGAGAAFDTHLPAVEQLVRELRFEGEGAPAGTGVQAIHGLDISLPPGWTRKDDPAGAVELRPPPAGGPNDIHWDYTLRVFPTRALRGPLWETHRAAFEELVRASGLRNTVPAIHEPSSPGPFIRSSTAGDTATGSVRALRLYSALSEGGIECVAIDSGQEDFTTTGSILHRVKVRKPPRDASRTKVVEAYRRLSQQLTVDGSSRGELLLGTAPYDRIWLRADGVADFTPLYPEGYAASRLQAKLDPTLQNGRIGSWKAVGEKEVHIVRQSGKPAEVYLREKGGLRLGDRVWQAMPSVDGLKLDGGWHLPGAAAESPPRKRRIEFTAAGRFTDDGALEDFGFTPVPAWAGSREVLLPRPPARGAGTYEIRDFTIFFKYDDGLLWSTDISTFGTDPKDLSKILLRSGVLHREP